jgi:hypothetical protein
MIVLLAQSGVFRPVLIEQEPAVGRVAYLVPAVM